MTRMSAGAHTKLWPVMSALAAVTILGSGLVTGTGNVASAAHPSTNTATATPSASSGSTGSTLYSDSFEGDAVGSVPSGWSVYGSNAGFTVQQNGSHVYNHNGWTATTIAGSSSWSNYSYSVQILPNNWQSESDGALFRVQNSSNYYQVLYQAGTSLHLQKVVNGATTTLASKAFSMSGSWHTLQLTANGSSLSVAVDGTTQLSATDSTFSTGAIGLAANSPVSFDTVQVSSLGSSVPSTPMPTNTPTNTPTSTPVATNTSTPTSTPTGTAVPTSTPTKTPVPTATASSTPTPTATASSTPTPTAASGSGGFPVTSATIKNKAGINPEPGMRPSHYSGPNPDGWWCQAPNCYTSTTNPLTMIDTELSLMAKLGVGVVRVEFDWPLIETSNGVYNWSRADYIVNEANKYGLQLQPVLVFTPSWAGSSLTSSPSNTQYWSSFVSQIVSRYKNSVHYWEMWNEPDGGGYWMDGDQKYVQNILMPGYQAVKAADPTAKVLLGAPYYADTTFLNDIYTYGGGNSFDITGFHEYSNVLSQSGIQGDINTVQSILNNHGQGSKPIWIGEYGYNEGSNTTNDTDHVTAMKIMLQQVTGYQIASWYNLRDDYSMTCCPPATVKAAYWGVVQHDDNTLKTGFTTMQQIIAGLG